MRLCLVQPSMSTNVLCTAYTTRLYRRYGQQLCLVFRGTILAAHGLAVPNDLVNSTTETVPSPGDEATTRSQQTRQASDMSEKKGPDRDDYTIGGICAIPPEYVAAIAVLDEEYAQVEWRRGKTCYALKWKQRG